MILQQKDSKKLAGRKFTRKLMIVSVAGALWLAPVVGPVMPFAGAVIEVPVASAASSKVTKLGEEVITSGAILMKYRFNATRSGAQATALADVVRVDLQNPHVKLDVMNGQENKLTTRQSTVAMAKENGAVAAINGDYFLTSGAGAQWVPMGAQFTNGTLVSSPADLDGMYSFLVTSSGTPLIDEYDFEGKVTAANGATFPITGINKGFYYPDNMSHSHSGQMYIYTSAWKSLSRPSDASTTPTEVLVRNGVIEEISVKAPLQQEVPEDGYILRTHGAAATFVANNLEVGQQLNADYILKSASTGKEVNPATIQTMISGHTLLVNNGKASGFTRDVSSIGGYRARTAVGYSKDGRYAYLIAVEKNSNSSGMSLSELQSFMVNIGVYKGLNLDGGGSTTMAHRPLAENNAQLTFLTEYGMTQRSIVNALGVFSTAPQGKLKGLKVSGTSTLLIGQEAAYTLKGYDTYYNPIDAGTLTPKWTASNGSVKVDGQSIKGVKAGKATIKATSGSVTASMDVQVLGASELTQLKTGNATGPLQAGASISIPVTATTKDGQSITISANALDWEFIGFKGSVEKDTLIVKSVNANTEVGYAIGRYDGFSTVVVLSVAGESIWEDFEKVSYPVAFTTNVSGVTGTAAITQGTEERAGSKVLQLQYDMTAGSGKMYAYAQLNGTAGRQVEAPATAMSIDVMGDSSLNWMRAEFVDGSGKTVYVDLAKAVDWSGWKSLSIDLGSYNMSYPATLKRLYVVNVEEGQDERAVSGTVAFDNIKFTMPSLSSMASLPKGQAKLVIGQKSMTVNGTKQAIDVAPIVRNNSTYVPIRFVLDAFGGSANWDSKNQRITILRGNTLLDLTVGQKDFILNGRRQNAQVAPMVLSGRTLVPLRLVSEQLGLNVKWEQKTKTVTIES